MTRIESIINSARMTLADKDSQRWSDDDLLLLLDEAHKDFASETQLLTAQVHIPVIVGQAYFSLPDDVWLITRVLIEDEVLPVVSHSDVDSSTSYTSLKDFGLQPSPAWESDTGYPKAFLYDRRNMLEGKLYPIPDESTIIENSLFNSPFGITTELQEYYFNQPQGVLTNLLDPDYFNQVNSYYGLLANLEQTPAYLKIYYVKTPATVSSSTDDLDTHPMWDKALKYYVVGHAFLNDLDTEYQQKGGQQLALYERELAKARKSEFRDSVRTGTLATNYRRVI